MASSPSPDPTVLIVGTGPIGIEYAKILQHLGVAFVAVGRGVENCARFRDATGAEAIAGGLENFLMAADVPRVAIAAASEAQLGRTSLAVLRAGVEKLLVEKPGGFTPGEIVQLAQFATDTKRGVFVGYNRRFYGSVRRGQEMIAEDGGVVSFRFEFTEWSHRIGPLQKEPGVKEAWFLHNSTHVIDLAFFLGGRPTVLDSHAAGGLPWHSHSRYAGSGRTETGALFSYSADWDAPGRWSVEVMTRKRRLLLQPLEKLFVRDRDRLDFTECPAADDADTRFKPGYLRQVQEFLTAKPNLLTIQDQVQQLLAFRRIGHLSD